MSALKSTPKVSVITPSYNQARFLPETLQSVRSQDYPNIEHIVVDGGSTDGSVEVLRQAPGIRWVSERDRGQVDAINKGFAMASGEVLAWLNSDDTLDPRTVSLAVAALERTGADMVYGDVEIVDEHGKLLKVSHGIPFDYRVLLYGIDYIGQQTVFFRRELLQHAGPLREEYDNGFDYELWLRFATHGELVYVPELRAQIRWHEAAKSVARAGVTRTDGDRLRAEYWERGGWPAFFQRRPWFLALNYGYRLKRKLIVWTSFHGSSHAGA
jgi:glycosyltransferase involved in cell wall biosynthesis